MKGNIKNNYTKCINEDFYRVCPKAVFAAIAVSYAANHQSLPLDSITKELYNEWEILFKNGLVPQKPIKY